MKVSVQPIPWIRERYWCSWCSSWL